MLEHGSYSGDPVTKVLLQPLTGGDRGSSGGCDTGNWAWKGLREAENCRARGSLPRGTDAIGGIHKWSQIHLPPVGNNACRDPKPAPWGPQTSRSPPKLPHRDPKLPQTAPERPQSYPIETPNAPGTPKLPHRDPKLPQSDAKLPHFGFGGGLGQFGVSVIVVAAPEGALAARPCFCACPHALKEGLRDPLSLTLLSPQGELTSCGFTAVPSATPSWGTSPTARGRTAAPTG